MDNTNASKGNIHSSGSNNDWILVTHKKYKNKDLNQSVFGTKTEEYITFKKDNKIKIY
jgi:hypothetical protein